MVKMSGTNEKKWVLYLHTTPCGKRYYGITSQKPKHRWNNGKGYKNNLYFTRAIKKYGWDNITHEILQEGLTKYEAQELEQYMIQWYDTDNQKNGYNLTRGGEGTKGICGEKSVWYGKHFSEEHRQKLRESHKGEKHPNYGKHLPEETRQKISEAHKGMKSSEEARRKQSETRKGKYVGKNSPRAKSVICLTTKKIFLTIMDASDCYNIKNSSDISGCCRGRKKSSGKYNGQKLVWKYLNYKHDRIYRIA